MHWATRFAGGDKRGDPDATDPFKGKVTRRMCQGIIKCNNPDCQIIIHPQTTDKGLIKQLEQLCHCGWSLEHITCPVGSQHYCFKDGVLYQNGGFHTHDQPTYTLHLSPNEQKQFKKLVSLHSKTDALKLAVGVGTSNEKATDISPVLLNVDRIRYEKRKVINPSADGLGLEMLAEFDTKHPGFLKSSYIGTTTVLSFQTSWMTWQLAQDIILSEPVNGFITDAAHNYWKMSDALLIVTSVYSQHLHQWIPVLFSYANGGTEDHYQLHFITLFNSLDAECKRQGRQISNEMFASVMDFSVAQSNGFIAAFIQFGQQSSDNTCSSEQLEQIANALLKGCEQHFRTGVTRLKKISGIVNPSLAGAFEKRALALLDAEDIAAFNSRAQILITEFPGVLP